MNILLIGGECDGQRLSVDDLPEAVKSAVPVLLPSNLFLTQREQREKCGPFYKTETHTRRWWRVGRGSLPYDFHIYVLRGMEDSDAMEMLLAKYRDPLPTDICRWQVDGDGIWFTRCGQAFEFTHGRPGENNYRFCPYCGKHVKEGDHGP